MASRVGPRSVSDATRFTSSIPHATSKSTTSASASTGASSSSVAARARAAAAPSRIPGETPEQRVKRLRQAHLAAQKAQISRTDRFIDASRPFLDALHRWTVGGIVVFTAVAGVVSIYSVWDMLRYNRARRAEWVEAQKKLEADALAVARIAYLKDQATPEQVALVEDANRAAAERGEKLPPLLAPPEHRTHFEETIQPAFQGGSSGSGEQAAAAEGMKGDQGKGVMGMFGGLFGGGGQKAAEAAVTATATASSEASAAAQATQTSAASLQDKAKDAWERELENQRRGGSLDKLGVDATSPAQQQQQPAKKGWWPW